MNRIETKSRYEPAYEANLSEWFKSITFTPFFQRLPSMPRNLLHVSTSCWRNKQTGGWIHVEPTPALIEAISVRSIFRVPGDTDGSDIAEEHHLEIVETDAGFKLLFGFSKVSGSYALSMIEEEDLKSWLRKAVEGQRLECHEWIFEVEQ